jgi:hypothetical protein
MFKQTEVQTRPRVDRGVAPGTGHPGDGIDSETGDPVAVLAAPPEPAMFGPADRVAPAPDAAMFGPPTDRVAPAPDPANSPRSLFQPIETETPESKSFSGPTPGGADSGQSTYRVYDGRMPEKQAVTDDRGTITTFISDLPQK